MGLIVYINDLEISDADIIKSSKISQKINFEDSKIIMSTMDIVIDNSDDKYSSISEENQVNGSDLMGGSITIYDDTIDSFIWNGTVDDIEFDDKQQNIVLKTVNNIKPLSDIVCVYSNSSVDITPAEAIYNILTDVAKLSTDDVIYNGFLTAINYQDNLGIYIDINYTIDDNTPCLSVINELCRMSHCHIYNINNKIFCYQWRAWDNELGIQINKDDVIAGSYKHYYERKYRVNSIRYAYNNSGTVAYYDLVNSSDVSTYGTLAYNVPNQASDSTTATDFKILITTLAGATALATITNSRYFYIKKYCEFTVSNNLSFIRINDQIDLNFSGFTNEPVRVYEKSFDDKSDTIKIKGEFLNLPHNYYSRDTTPPQTPYFYKLAPGNGQITPVWYTSSDTDIAGYKIYFSTTPGVWDQEISIRGQSPINVTTSEVTTAGLLSYYTVDGLDDGKVYYFKLTAYDTSLNESYYTQILSRSILNADPTYNYMLTGDLFLNKLTLNIDGNTSIPAEITDYNDFDSGEFNNVVTAFYQSANIYDLRGIDTIYFNGYGDIEYTYSLSADGITYSNYVAKQAITGPFSIACDGNKYLIIKLYFLSSSWSRTDFIEYVTHTN